MQNKNWHYIQSGDFSDLTEFIGIGVHPIILRLLINRGIKNIEDAKRFLTADLSGLHDPFLFKNMDKVVNRILQAKAKKERILVFGDYDVDGVTSSAVLNKILMKMSVDVIHHIPHRLIDGYGLNHEIARFAKDNNVSLLITVDCGITAVKEIESINDLGIDVIVIDHHEPGLQPLPNAFAIINPKQEGCHYPFKELAAVGLAFKLSQALTGKIDEELLHLTCLGTVSDVAPLVDENRIIVKAGLETLSRTKNKGLFALLSIGKIVGKKLTPYHIGFIIGPRINAAGRMNSAHTSLDLFLSESKEEAIRFAQELDQFNIDRQKMQREVVAEAMEIVEGLKDDKVIVLSKEGWHKGVLGIVASRLTDKYYKPAIVISVKDGIGTASARSISGFHIHDALAKCGQCLEEFGGHEGAAGLTILEKNIDPFRSMINKLAEQTMDSKALVQTLKIDDEIKISDITLDIARTIEQLQPFGEGNPMPIFCSHQCIVKSNAQILGKETLKFWVTDGVTSISAVGFGMSKFSSLIVLGSKVDLAYHISIDDWNKAPTPQLQLKDIKLSE